MQRRFISGVLSAAAAAALLPCSFAAAQAVLLRVAASAPPASTPPAPHLAPAAPSPQPRLASAPTPQPRLIDAPQPALSFSRSYSASGSANVPAAHSYATPNAYTGGVSLLDTEFVYVNYADAARLEFESLTASANRAAFGEDGGMNYTLKMSGVRAKFSMGGGDVQMSQSSLYGLTRSAATAEAGVEISDASHRYGFRVQGRAIVNQPIVMALPVVHQINVLTPEYPSLSAFWHF